MGRDSNKAPMLEGLVIAIVSNAAVVVLVVWAVWAWMSDALRNFLWNLFGK